MFEDKYIYVVHSDTDENNIYAEFENEAEALEYAKAHAEEQTYVERVYCEADAESGEIVDVYETEVIWDYASAEDLNEFLDAKVNVDFDGGDNNDVRVLSSFDPEVEGEPLDEFLDADINVSLDGGTGNKVDVLSKSLGEEVTEPKWNIGSNKLVSRLSQEYKNLEKLADMLEAQAGSNETYVVDRTYEDYGAGMEWYTIIHICDLERDDSYQLLSPKQWIYLANTGDVEGVYENIINKKPLKEEAVTLVAPEAEEDEDLDAAIQSRFTTLDLTKDEEIKVDSEVLDETAKHTEKITEGYTVPDITVAQIKKCFDEDGEIQLDAMMDDEDIDLVIIKQTSYGDYEIFYQFFDGHQEQDPFQDPLDTFDEVLHYINEYRYHVIDLDQYNKNKTNSLEENIDKMLEELEEHEDEVECQSCFELVAKESCTKNEKGHYICEKCGHPKEALEEEWDFEESLTESQAQEISNTYKKLSKDFGIDLEDLVWGENGFMMTKYPEGFPDFAGDVIYSEKYWEELVKFAESKGISLAADVYADEKLDEHIQDRPEPIETEQELEGTDNAVVDCKVADVITHSEEEKPLNEAFSKEEAYRWYALFIKLYRKFGNKVDPEKILEYCRKNGWVTRIKKLVSQYNSLEELESDFEAVLDFVRKFSSRADEATQLKIYDDFIGSDTQAGFVDVLWSTKLDSNLEEETHAQFAKPEGNRVQAYNNALKYAKQYNKEFIYGYTNHTGKFFALDQPIKVTGTARDAEKEFRNRYKNCGVVYMVYPNKTFIKEEAELEN